MIKKIYYKKGYKYQLNIDYECVIDIRPSLDIETDYISLSRDGLLYIKSGYAWDGPSGPTIDTPSFMRGSLVHDALYELIRKGYLDKSDREKADIELKKICLEDKMLQFRAWYVFHSVRKFGEKCASKVNLKKVIEAP